MAVLGPSVMRICEGFANVGQEPLPHVERLNPPWPRLWRVHPTSVGHPCWRTGPWLPPPRRSGLDSNRVDGVTGGAVSQPSWTLRVESRTVKGKRRGEAIREGMARARSEGYTWGDPAPSPCLPGTASLASGRRASDTRA